MIRIQKSSSDLPEVSQDLIKLAVKKTLRQQKISGTDITVRLTGNEEIKALNEKYRGIPSHTDVLSFNQDFQDPETGRLYLGDIIISIEQVKKQAHDHNNTLDEECAFLAIHGTLHLLGYDHKEPLEKNIMWQLQDKIFSSTKQEYSEKTG